MARLSATFGTTREWMRTRIFPSESELGRAQRLRSVAFSTFGVAAVALLVLIAIEPATAGRRIGSLAIVGLLVGIVHWLSRRGRASLASWLLVLGLVALVTQRAWITGGIYAPGQSLYVVFVLMGGVLLGRLGGIVTAAACAVAVSALAIGHTTGAVTPVREFAPPLGMLVFLMMILGIALVLQAMIGNTFRATLRRQEHEIERRRKTQLRLDLAMSAGKITVWELDRAGGRLLTDERMGELYGVDVSEDGVVAIDAVLARVHPDDLPQVIARREAIHREGATAHEHRVVRPDGSLRYVRGASRMVPGADGQGDRVVGVTMDVTELTLAERDRATLVRTLGERVKELQLLHETAVAAQRPWDSTRALLENVVSRMPPAWQHPECAEARITLGDVQVTTPGWRETPWKQSVPFSAAGQAGVIEVVYTEQRPDGTEGPFLKEERDVLVSLSEMLAAILDGQRSRRELEQLVEQRTAELRSARDAAEQAARAKGAFLANMSHEIRTPMNAILGYEQLLQADANLTDAQRRKLDVIRTSGDHLLSLINDILDMSRIEAGHTTLSVEPFDLHATLDDVRSMFATQTAKRGISLDVQVNASVPRGISADSGKVRQVLINLIGNAIKFTDAGGVRVRVRAARSGDTQCTVTIDVEDTGPGIDAGEFELIFSAFGQAKGGAARGGTGLGLPISRSFARLMDGDITVQSTKEHGSTFTFTFAGTVLDDVVVAPQRRRSAPHRLAAGETRRKILVVDDVPTNRELLAETLTRAGFDIRAAASGEESLDAHDAWSPDLIVTDLHMPGIGGLEAIRQLRARGSRTPVVVTTASTDETTPDRVRKAGAQQLLRKPHRERELLDAISRLLGVELVAADSGSLQTMNAGPIAPLESLADEIPAPLVAELGEAARKARSARILELAAEVERHSPAAAEHIRHLANNFRYSALLEALKGNGPHGD